MIIKNEPDIYDKLFPKGDILTNEEISELKSCGKTINFNKKDVIFRQGTLTSHVMYLETGLIKLFKDGRNIPGKTITSLRKHFLLMGPL